MKQCGRRFEFIDGRFYKVIASKNYARAYRVYRSGGKVVGEQLRRQEKLAPIKDLSRRSK
jgi:hypothetical protein